MTAVEVFTTARSAGILLDAEGDRLLVDAPVGVLTAEWRERLTAHKPQLLTLLSGPREFITLKNGPTLPAEAIEFALSLEQRGIDDVRQRHGVVDGRPVPAVAVGVELREEPVQVGDQLSRSAP